MNTQPYTWKSVEYLEKPSTRDERAIASTLEMILGTAPYDMEYLASVVADDAQISLSTENLKYITKAEYLEEMRKAAAVIKTIKYKNVLIRMNSEIEATVSCIRYSLLQNFRAELVNRSFDFRRSDGIWKITKATYY